MMVVEATIVNRIRTYTHVNYVDTIQLFTTYLSRRFCLMNNVLSVSNFIYSLNSYDKKYEVSVIRPDELKYLFYIMSYVNMLFGNICDEKKK